MPLSSSTIMRRNKPKAKDEEPDSREQLNSPPSLRNNNKNTKPSIIQSRRKQLFLLILVVFVIIILLSPNNKEAVKDNNNNDRVDDKNDDKNKSEQTSPINKTNNIRRQSSADKEPPSTTTKTSTTTTTTTTTTAKKSSSTTTLTPPTNPNTTTKCTFRKYTPRRHYQLHLTPSPPFLRNAKYIFGLTPTILSPLPTPPRKICVDTTSWDSSGDYPFSDGQNLSIVSLNPYPSPFYKSRNKPRLEPGSIDPLRTLYGDDKIKKYYLSVNYIGDSQCRWKETPEELSLYHISSLASPPSVRTVILLLDDSFRTLSQKDLRVDFDGVNNWGNKKHAAKERRVEALDDPRFFFNDGKLWVLFRVGKVFGYEEQVQAPVHFELTGDGKDWEVYIKNGEVVRVGLGRNIAIIGDDLSDSSSNSASKDEMKGVLLIDPLTVVPMTTERNIYKIRMGAMSSHIHGTNGYMIPLHDSGEFLGIGHFHRPYNRDSSDYARHGHHYTHAFFTIALKTKDDDPPKKEEVGKGYYLKRLSQEFLFPSMSMEGDADVIQFASGLEMVGGDRDGRLLISYGINDCEGAAVWLDMTVVQEMLKEVRRGSEVAEYMTISEGYDEALEKELLKKK